MPPMVAWTVFGLYTSTVFGEQKICSIPNQSAKRMIVPRFPGSCTSSSARQSEWLITEASVSYSGCSNTASTCWGVFNKLARERSSSDTSETSSTGSLGCCDNHSGVAARKRQGKCPNKSPTSLGPSARKTFSVLRFFFSSNEWIYLMRFLLSAIA